MRNLRRKLGNDLIVAPSVTVLIFDEQDRVLLVRHVEGDVWVAPGGMIEPGETPAEAAIREAHEETGCEVELVRLLGVFGGGEDFRVTYGNGDRVEHVMTVFEARVRERGERSDVEEILEVRYVSAAEIATLQVGRWVPTVLGAIFGDRTRAHFR
jgi:8-oxo-dGTP pyrophosphatase MutT (NUDIX family)